MNKKLFSRLFPPKYDFFALLSEQARLTSDGVQVLEKWLSDRSEYDYDKLFRLAEEVNVVRFKLENDLENAFLTPFSRQDIYIYSVRMSRIVDASKSVMCSCKKYQCPTDEIIISMAAALGRSALLLFRSTEMLRDNTVQTEKLIDNMRQEKSLISDQYREAMAKLFRTEFNMELLKKREIYRELCDASEHLDVVVDVLHRVVVRLT